MNTNDLISSLGAELTPLQPGLLTKGVLVGLGIGLATTTLIFAVFWGIRPDIGAILHDPALFAKSALSLLLGCLALPWVLSQARPGSRTIFRFAILCVPALALLAAVAALFTTPSQGWIMNLQGKSIATCLTSIPVLSAPILVALLLTLRRGAPSNPMRCGAVAGLLAGGCSAAVYSLYCVEDSPLFYGTWYTLALLIVAVTGAVAGRHVLRW